MVSALILANTVDSTRLAFFCLRSIRAQLPLRSSTNIRSASAYKMPLPPSEHRAPWRAQIDSHFSQTPNYEFTIATVGYDPQGRPVPRVRTCGCRGFFPDLDLHPNGEEAMQQQVDNGGNPPIYESDMLALTTDVRMEKLGQLESSGHAIEAVFWLKDLMAQWRVRGRAFAIGDPRGEQNEEESVSRQEIHKGLRLKEHTGGDLGNWTLNKAVTKYFANHSPIMRGRCYSLGVCLCFSLTSFCCSWYDMIVHADCECRVFQEPSSRAAQVSKA